MAMPAKPLLPGFPLRVADLAVANRSFVADLLGYNARMKVITACSHRDRVETPISSVFVRLDLTAAQMCSIRCVVATEKLTEIHAKPQQPAYLSCMKARAKTNQSFVADLPTFHAKMKVTIVCSRREHAAMVIFRVSVRLDRTAVLKYSIPFAVVTT